MSNSGIIQMRGQVLQDGLGRRSEQVLLTLRDEIEQGLFSKGQRLPTEMALCKRFGVTRPTVRRAIARLVADRRVQVRQGSGMCVTAGVAAPSGKRTISVMYPFDAEDLVCFQQAVLSKGFLLSVFSQARSHWDVTAERAFLELVLQERHAALVAFCSPLRPRNDEELRRLLAAGVRVIHIEHFCEQLPIEEYILPDYRRAGHMAAVALMLAGYQRVVYFGLNLDAPYCKLMEAGVAEALREHGSGYQRSEQFFRFPTGFHESLEAQQQFRDFVGGLSRSAGIVCDSSRLAGLVADTLRQSGYEVPEEFGVIGPRHMGPNRGVEHAPVDALEFDRNAMLLRALECVTQLESPPLRELVAPRLVRQGSIRQPK